MADNRATGGDKVHAKLLKVGGFLLAVKLNEIQARVVDEERWPVAWKGGRLVELFKGKGDSGDCDAQCTPGLQCKTIWPRPWKEY